MSPTVFQAPAVRQVILAISPEWYVWLNACDIVWNSGTYIMTVKQAAEMTPGPRHKSAGHKRTRPVQ